ncbi:putative Transcription elongation factor SPT4 [Blattamonas nauphoetae]|uniref:Transcription elongation factor SPT4 n=1 Tax=Blattamonas nauphoetae TaxID=2049346 RepID=A0ABQ9XWK1_9EUKA|nr:putative Transcription elongation factor SPT4 [Blattamonas nauphoetae]
MSTANESTEPQFTGSFPLDINPRHQRACLVCGLVKTMQQFVAEGCENCSYLQMKKNRERVASYTTTNFKSLVAVTDPKASWTAKWIQSDTFIPGCYAIIVTGDLPELAEEEIGKHGIVPKCANR